MSDTKNITTDWYSIYNGDSCDVLRGLPDGRLHGSIYSPPFALPGGGALYHYSSSDRDLSNARTFAEFLDHYGFIVRELHRLTMPGRVTAVHCTDVPTSNTGKGDGLFDLPGEIIRLHESLGWRFFGRYFVWKEPLEVRNRTMAKALAHKTIVDDATKCSNASADQLLVFRRPGENPVPVAHPTGLREYAGSREVPPELLKYRGWTGKQTENRLSHFIWRQYASAFWDDVRLDRVLPFRPAREPDDEKHCHPLQLDVVERFCVLWTNPGETVLTPFMGVGSEVYGAVACGRRGVGVELKGSYFKQAIRNLALVKPPTDEDAGRPQKQAALAFDATPRADASSSAAPLPPAEDLDDGPLPPDDGDEASP
jgi:hypothetical protein